MPNNYSNKNIFKISLINQNHKVNINFVNQKGKKVNLICPVNIRMKDLLVNYINILGFEPNAFGDSIMFLYNGTIININDNRNVAEIGIFDGSYILVLVLKGEIDS